MERHRTLTLGIFGSDTDGVIVGNTVGNVIEDDSTTVEGHLSLLGQDQGAPSFASQQSATTEYGTFSISEDGDCWPIR